VCMSTGECRAEGTCDQFTGACSSPPIADGTACSLGVCRGGACEVRDSGSPVPDAGLADGGNILPDAGEPPTDAGTTDAGSALADAGHEAPDAGLEPQMKASGCTCGSTETLNGLWFFGMLLLARRSKRRGRRSEPKAS
jgi:hypothetical protein